MVLSKELKRMKIVNYCETDEIGTCRWFKDEILHRDDGPAVEHINGTRIWYQFGLIHRNDGPAVESPDGTSYWYKEGNRHREDGPAMEYANGIRAWYQNGLLHREDGPAFEYPDGTSEWWINGKPINELEIFTKELLRFLEEIVEDDMQYLPDSLHSIAKELIVKGKLKVKSLS